MSVLFIKRRETVVNYLFRTFNQNDQNKYFVMLFIMFLSVVFWCNFFFDNVKLFGRVDDH